MPRVNLHAVELRTLRLVAAAVALLFQFDGNILDAGPPVSDAGRYLT